MGRTFAQRARHHRAERFFHQHGSLGMDWLRWHKEQSLVAGVTPAESRHAVEADAADHLRKGGAK